ncbi:hypothetical protein GGU11DRAFT_749630 [Lentinula aff. detonsa]|nr:hypothetical protein GGU11DRAFT_749630 [Lentinula aff. detonsa]
MISSTLSTLLHLAHQRADLHGQLLDGETQLPLLLPVGLIGWGSNPRFRRLLEERATLPHKVAPLASDCVGSVGLRPTNLVATNATFAGTRKWDGDRIGVGIHYDRRLEKALDRRQEDNYDSPESPCAFFDSTPLPQLPRRYDTSLESE